MTTGTYNASMNLLNRGSRGTVRLRYECAKPMWRASSATCIATMRSGIAGEGADSRKMFVCVRSNGTSPARTLKKKACGIGPAASGRIDEKHPQPARHAADVSAGAVHHLLEHHHA